jgi:hypothetical protein
VTDLVSKIVEWESGEMSEEDEISFFQEMVNSGVVWQLQGAYGRQAKAMLDAGVITSPFQVVGDSDDADGDLP